MAERFAALFQKISQQTAVFTGDTVQQIDQDLATIDDIRDQETRNVVAGIEGFLRDLYGIDGIDAVGLLAVRRAGVSTLLSTQVVARLEPIVDKPDLAFEAVCKADGRLARLTHDIFPGELQFIDSSGSDLNLLEQQLRKEWSQDHDTELLAFVRFQREQP